MRMTAQPPPLLMPYSWTGGTGVRSREPPGAPALCRPSCNLMPQFPHRPLIPSLGIQPFSRHYCNQCPHVLPGTHYQLLITQAILGLAALTCHRLHHSKPLDAAPVRGQAERPREGGCPALACFPEGRWHDGVRKGQGAMAAGSRNRDK